MTRASTPGSLSTRTDRVWVSTCCATVAAASILAKVDRDDTLTALDAVHPAYGWAGNKGYGAAAHRHAILERGATEHHRRSWNLGLPAPTEAAAADDAPPTLFG